MVLLLTPNCLSPPIPSQYPQSSSPVPPPQLTPPSSLSTPSPQLTPLSPLRYTQDRFGGRDYRRGPQFNTIRYSNSGPVRNYQPPNQPPNFYSHQERESIFAGTGRIRKYRSLIGLVVYLFRSVPGIFVAFFTSE
eukprot:sb/3474763/